MMSKLIQHATAADDANVVYHFCNYRSSLSIQYGHILRSIVAQFLRNNDDLLAFVYDEYVLSRKVASLSDLEKLVPILLSSLSNNPSSTAYVRIFIDGIDECEDERQQKLLGWLHSLSTSSSSRTTCKILVAGRNTQRVMKFAKKKSMVQLTKEHVSVSASIRTYVGQRFHELRASIEDSYIAKPDIDYVEETIVRKADGMFLWARLIADVLSSDVFFDAQEMRTAIDTMPKELTAL